MGLDEDEELDLEWLIKSESMSYIKVRLDQLSMGMVDVGLKLEKILKILKESRNE